MYESGGGMEGEKTQRRRKQKGRRERGDAEGWATLTRRQGLRRVIHLPGFSSAQSQGFWGPLSLGSPLLLSRAGQLVSAWPLNTSLLPLGLKGAHPSSRKEPRKESKTEIKCSGGKRQGCVRKGCCARATSLIPLPRCQVGRPRASEVWQLSTLWTSLLPR